MKRVLSLICILLLSLPSAVAEGRSCSRCRSQNYAIDSAGNVYWLVNYSREHNYFLYTTNEEWGEIYRLSPETLTCEKVADCDRGLWRIDYSSDALYIESILREYDFWGVKATVIDYRVPIEQIGDHTAWEPYKEAVSYGVSPVIHEDSRFLACMDRLFVMDGNKDTLSVIEGEGLRVVANCLDVYSQYDTFLELRDDEAHSGAAQTRIYDPEGDRIVTLPFSPMDLSSDCALLDGDALYQIGVQGLTRCDIATGQIEILSELPPDSSFRYDMCMDTGCLYILDKEQQTLMIWSLAESCIFSTVPLPKDFPMDASVFAVSRNVAIFYDDGVIYEERLTDTLKKAFYMFNVNSGVVRRFEFGVS